MKSTIQVRDEKYWSDLMTWLLIWIVAKVTELLITELFIRRRKWHVSTIFIMQPYFKVPKDIKLNSTHYFYYKNSKQKRASTNCN